jgi:hypothetical protein
MRQFEMEGKGLRAQAGVLRAARNESGISGHDLGSDQTGREVGSTRMFIGRDCYDSRQRTAGGHWRCCLDSCMNANMFTACVCKGAIPPFVAVYETVATFC